MKIEIEQNRLAQGERYKRKAQLISKTISQKRFGSLVIPGLRLSKVTNKWNKRFQPEKAAESEEFRQTALFFNLPPFRARYSYFSPSPFPSFFFPLSLSVRRFSLFFRSKKRRKKGRGEISAIQNLMLGFLIK